MLHFYWPCLLTLPTVGHDMVLSAHAHSLAPYVGKSRQLYIAVLLQLSSLYSADRCGYRCNVRGVCVLESSSVRHGIIIAKFPFLLLPLRSVIIHVDPFYLIQSGIK